MLLYARGGDNLPFKSGSCAHLLSKPGEGKGIRRSKASAGAKPTDVRLQGRVVLSTCSESAATLLVSDASTPQVDGVS